MRHQSLTGEQRETAENFALGILSKDDALVFADHIRIDKCDLCLREVSAVQAAFAMLAADVPAASPSARARERLMAQAGAASPIAAPSPRTRWREWLLGLTAAACAAGLVFTLSDNAQLRRLNDSLSTQVAALESQIRSQTVRLARYASTDVRVVNLAGQNANARASGRVFWDTRESRWVFYAKDLPQLPVNLTYQLWFVPTAGNPVSATVFNSSPDGSVDIEIPVPAGLTAIKAAAVTTEPAGGLPQPSGQFALLGAIQQ